MNAPRTVMLTALLALMIPATGAAQRGPFGHGGAAALEHWLELSDELDLTEDQVARLGAIRERLQTENATHLQRIETVRDELGLPEFRPGEGAHARRIRPRDEDRPREPERPRMSDEDRQKMRDFMDRTRDDRRAIMDNSRDAMEDARDVLTDEQRDLLRDRMRARRGERGERGMRGHRGEKREHGDGGH